MANHNKHTNRTVIYPQVNDDVIEIVYHASNHNNIRGAHQINGQERHIQIHFNQSLTSNTNNSKNNSQATNDGTTYT